MVDFPKHVWWPKMGETNWVIIFPVPSFMGIAAIAHSTNPHIISNGPCIPLYPTIYPMIFPYMFWYMVAYIPMHIPIDSNPKWEFCPPWDPFLPLSKRGCGRSETTKPWVRSLGTMADGGGHRRQGTHSFHPQKIGSYDLHASVYIHTCMCILYTCIYYKYTD